MRLRVSSLVSKVLFLTGAIVISSVGAFAATNSISGVDVKQIENGEYSVILKMDRNANIKKISDNMDTLDIVINSALPVEDMEIVYDNAADLKNVIVQKKNANNTVISLQGKNVENAKIYTKELSTNAIKEVKTFALFNFADNKSILFGLIGLLMFMMLKSSKKSKKQNSIVAQEVSSKKARKSKKQTINTINKRNKVAAQNIPSINYRINGSFAASQQNMSIPKDFVINQYQKEQMRKVG